MCVIERESNRQRCGLPVLFSGWFQMHVLSLCLPDVFSSELSLLYLTLKVFAPSQHVLGEVPGVNMSCFKVLIYAIKCLVVFRGCCSSSRTSDVALSIRLSALLSLSAHFKYNPKSTTVYSHSSFFRL